MGPDCTIREYAPPDRSGWLAMRYRLWPQFSIDQLQEEQINILSDGVRNCVLVAVFKEPELAGFVEVSLREWAEGCTTHPVGYIEAWYVEPSCRRQGVGRRLIEAAERWARARGCTEMASDADLGNQVSHSAHRALSYTEVGRAVLYAKKLAN